MSSPSENTADLRPSRQAKYWDLFDRLTDPTFLLHAENFSILDSNPAAEKLLGKSARHWVGKSLTDFLTDEDRQIFHKRLRIAARRYHPVGFEAPWSLGDDRRLIMEMSACSITLSKSESMIQLICHDVTDVRNAQAQLRDYVQQLSELNRRLEELSTHDELTGLANVRHFKEKLKEEHARCQRFEIPYSVIFCDVDHFKQYNDREGHVAGDQVLRELAGILKDTCRGTDLPARYGGEEFVILCPGLEPENVSILTERVRKKIQGHPFKNADRQPLGCVSLSMGVASYPFDGDGPQDLLKKADEALYRAKHDGRNRMCLYRDLQKLKKTA